LSSSSTSIWGTVLLCSATLASCGGATLDASNADGGSPDPGAGVELCDGRTGVRLWAGSSGGGLAPPGVNMLAENGWHYLLLSGQCEAWVLKEPEAPLRHLTLSREQARSLARDFRLGEWKNFLPALGGCPDAPTTFFRFDKDFVSGIPCGLKPDHPLHAMSAALVMQIENLYAAGIAAEGDVRYLLAIEEPDAPRNGDAYRNAPPWPLSASPNAVAVPLKDIYNYQRGESRRESAEGAAPLRALRTSWLDGAIGWRPSQFTPVVETDGARFRLYLRDSSPWENVLGVLPEDLTR
jgi:hypothetical protein